MILLIILLYICLSVKDNKFEAYIKASVIWTLILLVLVYCWSLISQLNFVSLSISYLVLDLGILFFLIFRRKDKFFVNRNKISFSWTNVLGICELTLFGIVFYYAMKSVPYNWDSMTYHLARIANWAQNQSVFPYATHIERQIASPVLGAYINLFVYILGGNKHDTILNLLQCVSYGANAWLLYGITRRLGIGEKLALWAPLLYMCTPIALAEATTTQVDNFATWWLLAFIYLLLPILREKEKLEWCKTTKRTMLYAALCIAFGYMAKPSVCFAMLLFLIWMLITCIQRKTDYFVMIKYVILVIPALLVTILPGMIFNYLAFGSITHSAVGQRQLIGSWKPQYVLVNFLKNFSFNLASARVESTRIFIEKFLYKVAEIFRIDLNDPVISEDGGIFAFPDFPALNCDVALNMFLLVTAIFMFFWFIVRIRREAGLVRGFSVFALSAYVVFCCALRWERFINRYIISYFALLAIFIVLQLQDMSKKLKKSLSCGIGIMLIIGSLVNFREEIRYLRELAPFSENDGYFAYHGDNKEAYPVLIDAIKQSGSCRIGLIIGGNTYEYPIWSLLDDKNYEIRHIMVENASAKYEKSDFIPDCIWAEGREEVIQYHGIDYFLAVSSQQGDIGVYFAQ